MPPPRAAGAAEADTLRLFLALWPTAPARSAAQAWQKAAQWPSSARLTAPQNLHLTLHFLGPVERVRLPELVDALALPLPPMDLQLDRAEIWPNAAAVLVPSEPPHPLLAYHARLGDAVRGLHLPVEDRPYRPHLTLARKARDAVWRPCVPVSWTATSHVLVESRGGYHVLHEFQGA